MKTSDFYVIADHITDNPHAQTLRFIGVIDKTNINLAKRFIAESINQETLHLTVDFKKLSFISTSALSVIVLISKLVIKRDGSLTLSNLDANFSELFHLSGIGRLFDLSPGTGGFTALLSLERCKEYVNQGSDFTIQYSHKAKKI